jgi:hypothetical protein
MHTRKVLSFPSGDILNPDNLTSESTLITRMSWRD